MNPYTVGFTSDNDFYVYSLESGEFSLVSENVNPNFFFLFLIATLLITISVQVHRLFICMIESQKMKLLYQVMGRGAHL